MATRKVKIPVVKPPVILPPAWLYEGNDLVEPPAAAVGFVYRITRLDTGRKYLGKKLLTFRRTKLIKGVKKKVTTASEWVTYYGSNAQLKADVKELGYDNFLREILYLCYSRTECNYNETLSIINERALFSTNYYNDWFSCKITKSHVSSAVKSAAAQASTFTGL